MATDGVQLHIVWPLQYSAEVWQPSRGFGRFQHTTVTISGFFKTTTVRVNFQTDGPNWENLEDAAHDYKSLKDEKRVQGLLEPQGWGVLIGDEVKVVAKIQWNSRNNE